MKFFKRMPNLHPNGFWIYLIKAFWNGARLRLHYWPKDVKRLDTPHDHRSWFISIPLWGRLLEKRFVETVGDDHEVLRCHSTSGNGLPITKPLGRGSVKAIFQRHRYPLLPYLCRSDTIHSLTPCGRGPAVTVVLFGPPKKIPRAWIPLCGQPSITSGDPCTNPAEEPGRPCFYCREFNEMCKLHDDALEKEERL